jgi:predicted transcriptional regulator
MQIETNIIKHFDGKLEFKSYLGNFFIYGDLPVNLGSMNISLVFEETYSLNKYRIKIDLFEKEQVVRYAKKISEAENINCNEIDIQLSLLTNELEKYRELDFIKNKFLFPSKTKYDLEPKEESAARELLESTDLMNNLNSLIEESGITGEENNRLLLFLIASSYKSSNPLHTIISGSSGSGKSHLTNKIAAMIPEEDVINLTRVSNKSFFNFCEKDLKNKLLVIQDYDGLDIDAQYALREMQSSNFLSYSVSVKNKYGNYTSQIKKIQTHFSSICTTTKNAIYWDNSSRSLIIGVDESDSQTNKIINYQRLANKELNFKSKQETKITLVKNCVRILKSYEVINPFADKISLPIEIKSIRRLNQHFQDFISQITLIHQYQRKKDKNNNLYSTIEDVEIAANLFFEILIGKIDELDSQLRVFFEKLKKYISKQSKNYEFTTKEIRENLNVSKTQVFRFFNELKELEYLTITKGSSNKGFYYKINHWDDNVKMKIELKKMINSQVVALKKRKNEKK